MSSDPWDLALAAEWETETTTVQIVEPWHCRNCGARWRSTTRWKPEDLTGITPRPRPGTVIVEEEDSRPICIECTPPEKWEEIDGAQ